MINVLPIARLGEFLTYRKEFFTIDDFVKYKRARVRSHGQGIVLRDEVYGSEIKTKKQQAARTGEFLVAEIDAKVGGFGIVPPELNGAIVSSHYFLFQINESKCSKEWLNWFVRYNSLEEQTKAQGSTNYAAIRPNDVLNFEIPLPSLMDQRRILGHIDALAARVNEAQMLREDSQYDLRAFQISIIRAAIDGKLVHQDSTDEPADVLLHRFGRKALMQKDLPHLPIGWCWTTLESIASNRKHALSSGPFGSALGTKDYIDQGVPVIRGQNIQDGSFSHENFRYISEEKATELQRSTAHPGDIVVVAVGSSGRPAIVPNGFSKAILSQNCNKITLDENIAFNQYILLAMQTDQSKIQLANKTTDTARPFLSLTNLKKTIIPLPPLNEQRRIVAYLDGFQAKVNALRELQVKSGEELSALMPSILDKAFKGEL